MAYSRGENMNTVELVAKIKEEAKNKKTNIPEYINVEDIGNGQLCIDKKWQCIPSVWGICRKNGLWIYFNTDSERGYISGMKEFNSEEELCDYVYSFMSNKINAWKNGYSHEEMTSRYIVKKFGYSEDKAIRTVGKIAVHKDIFEEMFNYMRRNKFVGECIEVEGVTAQELVRDEGFTVVAAYRFLSELRENPNEAKELLASGIAEKK